MGLRILLVSDHYPPFIGGAHRQTYLLAKELTERGHEVSVVTSWQPGLPTSQQEAGIQIYRLKELRSFIPWLGRNNEQRHHPPYPDPVTVWGLRRLIAKLKPEIVHAHGWFSYSCAVALLGQDIPLLLSTRDYGYSCATRTLLYKDQLCSGPSPSKCLTCATAQYGMVKGTLATWGVWAGKALLRHKVKGIHSVSSYVQSIIERDLYGQTHSPANNDEEQVNKSVISSFLISDGSLPNLAFLQQLPREPFILFVGGLQLRKGLSTLLAAYQQLQSAPPLVLVGYNSLDTPKEFPAGVIVLRDASHATVMATWERALFGVVPSLWPDPSPGVVREAMSKGKAVIGTDIGGTSEMIIDGKTGLLVPPGDVTALAVAMQRLIATPALCAQMGVAAQAQARVYMSDVSVPRFERLYGQLISGQVEQPNQQNSFPVGQTKQIT